MESTASSSYFGSLSFEQVLDDLSSRFIVNLPTEELESIERICFQIEQAHWYYEDFVRPQASHLPSFSLRKFSEIIFKSNPLLSHFDAATAYDQFLRYKERVPVCGAILLSSGWDKCLVVKGWKSGASWSFPRGKINQGEDERDCAVREVWEETGYDISPHFNPSVAPHPSDSATCPPPLPPGRYPEDDYLECVMKEQRIRLYIVPNVSEDTLFETKTRKEISKIAWAPLTSLPTWNKKGKSAKKEIKCYMITPFVNPLKAWIQSHRTQRTKKPHEEGTELPTPSKSPSTTVHHNPQDVQLESQTQALQDFFFGSLSKPQTDASPIAQTLAANTQFEATPSISQTSSQARYLQNLQVLSPVPKSPGRTVENLHRQIMRRGYEHTGPPSSADTRASPSLAHSTLKALSANHQAFSSVASPSFTDYRNSALSPSGFDSHHSDVSSARVPIYTEAEREAARYSLLGQLASQLGTPTPPSAGESSDDGATDDGTSRQDSGRELMNLIKQQLDDVQPYGDKVPVKYQQRASETPSMALPHPAQPQRQSPGRSSQHMLSILNGTSGSSPWLAPQHPPATQLSGSGISPSDGGLNALPAVSNPADHTSSLLNLFNSQSKPTISQTAALNAPSPGHIDIARLFADVRL